MLEFFELLDEGMRLGYGHNRMSLFVSANINDISGDFKTIGDNASVTPDEFEHFLEDAVTAYAGTAFELAFRQ